MSRKSKKSIKAPKNLFIVHDGHGIVEGDGLYGDLKMALREAEERANCTGNPWYVAQYSLSWPAVSDD